MKIALPSELSHIGVRQMSLALQGSLQYLTEEIGGDKPPSLYAKNFYPTWRSHAYYHACIRDISDGRLEQAQKHILKSIENVRAENTLPAPRYLLPSDGAQDMQLLHGELALHTDRVIGAGYVTSEVAASDLELGKVREATRLLANTAPEFYQEFCELADEVLLIGEDEGVHIRSASSFNLFGLIIMWADPIHTPIYYLQQIVHEVAHLRLFMINIEDELVLNPPEHRYKAPFRDDERPMLGIYHAMFVLARMVLALREVAANLPAAGTKYLDLQDKLSRSEERFHNTVREVEEHGIMTEIGRAIFDDCKKMVGPGGAERLRRVG